MRRFEGQVALVTGAASGIGAAIAAALATEGARLALVDVAAIDAPEALTLRHDVADPAAWAQTEAAIRARFGRLDLVVANAGVADAGAIAEMEFAAWRRVLSANLDGAFLTLQCGFRLIAEGGAMLVVSSVAGVKAEPGTVAYSASKAGAAQLAKVAAKEGAARGVRVNALLPGGVETPIWRGMPFFQEMIAEAGGDEAAAFRALAGAATPLGRYATAEEIAAQALFLLSPAAATITGAALISDGGYAL